MATNLNISNNTTEVSSRDNSITITDNNTGNIVNISQQNTPTVTVSAVGIQGAVGPQGIPGEVAGSLTADNIIQPFTHITSSGNISASGNIIGLSGSFSELSGNSPLVINGVVNFTFPITSSGNVSSSGNIIGSTGSFAQTVITLKSGAEDSPFIITIADNNGQDNKLQMTKDGVLRFGALNNLPTAITGGLVYSSSAFYMGL